MTTSRITLWSTTMLGICFGMATLLFAVHDLRSNPQYDNQGMWYASDAVTAIHHGTVGEFLLTKHKYPLAYFAPYIPIFLLMPYGGDPTPAFFGVGRALSLLYGIGSLALLWLLGKRLKLGAAPVILAMTSIMFVLFSSAIRPHIAVTFWTLLTLLCSLRLAEKRDWLRTACAFGAALLAFCMLQDGLLAFLFPVWALLQKKRGATTVGTAIGMVALCAALSIPLGYPFLLATLAGGEAVGVDLGHDVGLHFGLIQVPELVSHLLGNNPIILLFACIGIVRLVRGSDAWQEWHSPVLVYCAVFTAIFLFHTSAVGRFFLPVLAMLCLVGASAFGKARPWLQIGTLVLATIVMAKLSWLALQPNTYQQVRRFADQRSGLVFTYIQPYYFFGFTKDRVPQSNEEIESAMTTFISPDQDGSYPDPMQWQKCFAATASRWTDDIVLLWNDTPWAYAHALGARALGPNFTVWCKNGS